MCLGQSLGWCRHRSVPATGPVCRAQRTALLKPQQCSNVESLTLPRNLDIAHPGPRLTEPTTVWYCEPFSSPQVHTWKRDDCSIVYDTMAMSRATAFISDADFLEGYH